MPTSSLLRCLLSLFFDNLSTMLGITGAFIYGACDGDQVAKDITCEACEKVAFRPAGCAPRTS